MPVVIRWSEVTDGKLLKYNLMCDVYRRKLTLLLVKGLYGVSIILATPTK